MKRTLAIAAAFAFFGSVTPSMALDKRYPDWPCKQLKVPVLSPAAIWAGPPSTLSEMHGKGWLGFRTLWPASLRAARQWRTLKKRLRIT